MKFKLVGIGEVLWDLLPGGRQMGGAPANFAYHAGALGAEGIVISRVGQDELGHELRERLRTLGVPTYGVEVDPSLSTGTVSVEVDDRGEPRFTIRENVAWDNLAGEPPGRHSVEIADAVCFGTLAQRSESSRSSIRSLVLAASSTALRIFDVNLRQHYYSQPVIEESLAWANVLKVNESELPRLAKMFDLTGDAREQMARLAERHRLRVVAYTRGGNGSLLLVEGRWSEHPGVPTRVVDTIGAGDSFTAAMALGLLQGWDIDEVNLRANEVAAFVASCPGGTAVLPDSVRAPFLDSRSRRTTS